MILLLYAKIWVITRTSSGGKDQQTKEQLEQSIQYDFDDDVGKYADKINEILDI